MSGGGFPIRHTVRNLVAGSSAPTITVGMYDCSCSSTIWCNTCHVQRHVLGLLFVSVVTGDNVLLKHIIQSAPAQDEDSR